MDEILEIIAQRDPGQTEFIEAVREVLRDIGDFLDANPRYREASILERIIEPERVIMFRVPWTDDRGVTQVNRGLRVEFNSAVGPYKGGIRFHPSVNLSIIKFLAFEQIFKNALTGIPMGGAKGGSDFDPKGKSDSEVMRFCQGYMTELSRHIGPHTDVPAGDIGVGMREIGFMFGQYKKLRNEFTGVLSGLNSGWGGTNIRPEATGYGAVYFAEEMLKTRNEAIAGKTCLISGSGNVAQFTAEKLIDLGAVPVALSDSGGFIHDPGGITREKLEYVKELKNVRRGRIKEYAGRYPDAIWCAADPALDHNPLWDITAGLAFPCATQNEINGNDADNMIRNGVMLVCEGANMPATADAVRAFREHRVLHAPGKASNAGGVAVSGLEMCKIAPCMNWSRDTADQRLHLIMQDIHSRCIEYGTVDGFCNYFKGANIAGFKRVADAMLAQGVV